MQNRFSPAVFRLKVSIGAGGGGGRVLWGYFDEGGEVFVELIPHRPCAPGGVCVRALSNDLPCVVNGKQALCWGAMKNSRAISMHCSLTAPLFTELRRSVLTLPDL